MAAAHFTATATDPTNEDELMDSFRTLGISRRYGLDSAELRLKYHTLMKEYHPDKHQDKSIDERNLIDEKAAGITHAFQTLSHPSSRAKHLLTLLGNPVSYY